MRIAIVHSYYSAGDASGENNAVDAQARQLREEGHEVTVLARSTDERAQGALYAVTCGLRTAAAFGPSPERALAHIAPDVIHVHNTFPNWGTSWLARVQTPAVATLHNYRPLCAAGSLWRDGAECRRCPDSSSVHAVRFGCYRQSRLASVPLAVATRRAGGANHVLRYPEALIVLNESSRREYAQRFPGKRFVTVPNFVADAPGSGRVPRAPWLYAGRLAPEKGVLWLLQNWPLDTPLDIVGAGPLQDLVATEARKRMNIRFLGQLDNQALRVAMASARGLVVPSLWGEGLPTVALEAMCGGTPLLVSCTCASAVELTAEGAGLTFSPPDGQRGLANGIRRIDRNHAFHAAGSRRNYERNFSAAAWSPRIMSVYEEAIRLHEQAAGGTGNGRTRTPLQPWSPAAAGALPGRPT